MLNIQASHFEPARREWLMWQLADSAFPSGGFAHSGGIEAAWQFGMVGDGQALQAVVQQLLIQLDRGVLRFVERAAASDGAFDAADAECDLFLNNHVANRASRAQGRAFLASAARIFQVPSIEALSQRVRAQKCPGHFAASFGAVTSRLAVPTEQALSLFRFMTLRGCLSSAVRLGIVGPLEAQQIQADWTQNDVPPNGGTDSPVQTAPLLDLLQGTQDRLYSRLFQS